MGSEEESGKDWSELEEEAARGELKTLYLCLHVTFCFVFFLTAQTITSKLTLQLQNRHVISTSTTYFVL